MLSCQYIMAVFSTASGSRGMLCAFAMTNKVTWHAQKQSLRGAACCDAAIHMCLSRFNALHVDRRRLRLRDDGLVWSLPQSAHFIGILDCLEIFD